MSCERETETPDEVLRQWALDTAVAAHRRGVGAERILRDAREFYGFLRPQCGKVEVVKDFVKDG